MILKIILILPWGILEITRLYNGYAGNIRESFPEMVSFFVVSIATLGILIFYTSLEEKFPTELAFLLFQIFFGFFELIFCFVAMKGLIKV